jgi:polysaccharide export outer membrane protein
VRIRRQLVARMLVAMTTCAVAGVTATAQTAKPAAKNASPTTPQKTAPTQKPSTPAPVPQGIVPPPGYVIGPNDILTIVFWRDKDMSGDVNVRPDGKVTLPLINDIQAAGLTPDQLRLSITEAAKALFEDPTISVVVKEIHSRQVFITGQVGKSGPYPLMGPMTVMQLIALAGGLQEFAKTEDIGILRTENGKQVRIPFNYKEVTRGKNLQQNIELKPGDQVVVP